MPWRCVRHESYTLMLLTGETMRHGQNCTYISGHSSFRDLEATGQARTDTVPKPLTHEASGYLPAAQASLKPADAMILPSATRTLTHFCPMGLSTPGV